MNVPAFLLLHQVTCDQVRRIAYPAKPIHIWPEYESRLEGREKAPSMFSLNPDRGV